MTLCPIAPNASTDRMRVSLLAETLLLDLLQEFLDFVLAWQCKNSVPAMTYFFTIYDLKKVNRITGVEIYIFLMEIYKMVRPSQDARPAGETGKSRTAD